MTRIERIYGISEDEYWAMAGARCCLCDKPWTAGRRPVVDHAHAGEPYEWEIRGAPCSPCNEEISRRSADWHARAAAYLRFPPAHIVVGRRRIPGAPPSRDDAAAQQGDSGTDGAVETLRGDNLPAYEDTPLPGF